MKLSQLVGYLNNLDNHNADRTLVETQTALKYLDNLVHMIQTNDLQFPGVKNRMDMVRNSVDQSFRDFDQAILALKNLIQANIEIWEPTYFQSSYKLYHNVFAKMTHEQILKSSIDLDPDTENYLRSRLALYGDWKHPGMVVRPAREAWVTNMTALDPLYIVDTDYELMAHAISQFPGEYQARLRKCVISETKFTTEINPLVTIGTDPYFSPTTSAVKIPYEQIGMTLIYNYFNFKPLDFILDYLLNVYMWLKPGGTVIFTFNNCDRVGAVELVENDSACYTPGRLLLSGIENSNFEIVHSFDINASTTWVEARKPGILSSQRAGQALARPVAKANRIQ